MRPATKQCNETRRTIVWGSALLGICVGVLVVWLAVDTRHLLTSLLTGEATKEDKVPFEESASPLLSGSVIYVLGGAERSLLARFAVAANLYRAKAAPKILILNRSGLMGYDTRLGRNPTMNEWAIDKLVTLGVKEQDIEIVPIEHGLLGTWTEGEGIGKLAEQRGYSRVLVVSSWYHARRVDLSFARPLGQRGVEFSLIMSHEDIGVRGL